MMTNENLEILKLIFQNWNTISKIPRETWEKIRRMFMRGDKTLGFIRRKSIFLSYIQMSEKSFLHKYSKYIVPAEYNGYLLESIIIKKLYERGEKKVADEKKTEMRKINPRANRICNLYCSDILNVVFAVIDRLITEGKDEEQITGAASKVLDDLINDKSIIYVNNWQTFEELVSPVKLQLREKGYCIMYGSGKDNINKITRIYESIMNDMEFQNFQTDNHTHEVADIPQFSLLFAKKEIYQISNE